MGLLGKAAVAMWWDIETGHREEFEHWHSHEHFPERMGIPGFRRGSRWAQADGGEGFFVMYELDDYATLTSAGYLASLNHPTPWSTRMMPLHCGMVRSQCRMLDSFGAGIGRFALTLRVSPVEGQEEMLRAWLGEAALAFTQNAGGVACHLLRTETPDITATREQQIRGGKDAVADWILVATGYERGALESVLLGKLQPGLLQAQGARDGSTADIYELAYAATPADFTAG